MTRPRCDLIHNVTGALPLREPLESGALATTEAHNKVSEDLPAARPSEPAPERRQGSDRRKRTIHALLYGGFVPRRRGPRRGDVKRITDLDWHHPQWLAVAMLILLLSCADAVLTLTLLNHGATEVNPVMAALLEKGSGLAFVVVKIGLTAMGTVLLILLARMRAFRWIPVSLLLYAVLLGYVVLVGYELWLLEKYAFHDV